MHLICEYVKSRNEMCRFRLRTSDSDLAITSAAEYTFFASSHRYIHACVQSKVEKVKGGQNRVGIMLSPLMLRH